MRKNTGRGNRRNRWVREEAFARWTALRWRESRRIRTQRVRNLQSQKVQAGKSDGEEARSNEGSSRFRPKNFQNSYNGNSRPLRPVLQVREYFNHAAFKQISVQQNAKLLSRDIQQLRDTWSAEVSVEVRCADPAIPEPCPAMQWS